MHHKPTPAVGEVMTEIRHSCCGLAKQIVATVPEGIEKELAIIKLQEVMFWANAGLARS